MSQAKLLKRLYYNPETGYISALKLYKKARVYDPLITLKTVKDWYSKQPDIQQFQTQLKRYDDFKIASPNLNSWQIDLMFWRKQTVLTCVNINSRLGYLKLLPNKTAEKLVSALKTFTKLHNVEIITSDNGSEFMNNKVQKFFKDNNIEHFNNEAGEHSTLGKIERFNRTIKQRLERINKQLTPKVLTDVMNNYNSTKHTSIHATPNEMCGQVIQAELEHNKNVFDDVSSAFNIGDHVRYKLQPKTFGKESVKYSKSVYQIVGIDGYKFHVRSKNNHVLYKSANELKVVDSPLSDAALDNNQI